MAIIENNYTGDGSTVLFSITFPYRSAEEITAWIDLVQTTAFTLANATTVEFDVAPAVGAEIRLLRVTDLDSAGAVFYAGSAIRAADLNENTTQLLYAMQEAKADSAEARSLVEEALVGIPAAVAAGEAATTAAAAASASAAAATVTANEAHGLATTATGNASTAVTTANSADDKADAAIAAVASVNIPTTVAAVANIPGSPANGDTVRVLNSTGIQSFTPLTGVPGGFVGDSGLAVTIQYSTGGATWQWVKYEPNDPDSRYLVGVSDIPDATTSVKGLVQLSDSTSTTSSVLAATPTAAKAAYDRGSLGVTNAATAQTTADNALAKAGGTMTGAITFAGGQTFPTSGIASGSTSAAGILQLSTSTSSSSTTLAATPSAVKSAYDLANAALPKAGGTITGDVDNTSTGYFDIPAGTTAQRPGSPTSGMVRYNSDLSQFEGYGSAWAALGGKALFGTVQTVTSDTVLTSASSHDLINATSPVKITLPAVASGLVFGFTNNSSEIISVYPAVGTTYIGPTQGAVTIDPGKALILTCDSSRWNILSGTNQSRYYVRHFSASTTYVPSTKCTGFLACVFGATGGTRTTNDSRKGGSGGGGYSEKLYTAPLAGSYSIVIGAGGLVNADGGVTTFGGTISVSSSGQGSTLGGAGGVGSGGDFNATGGAGAAGGNNAGGGGGGGGGAASRAGNGGNGSGNSVSGGSGGGTGGNNAPDIATGGAAATADSVSATALSLFTNPVYQPGVSRGVTASDDATDGAPGIVTYTPTMIPNSGSPTTLSDKLTAEAGQCRIGSLTVGRGKGGDAYSGGSVGVVGDPGYVTVVEFF